MVFKKSDISYLKQLTSKKDHNKSEIQKVIDLYEQRKIPRRDTAELLIVKLKSKGKKINESALKRLETYEKNESKAERSNREKEEDIRVRVVGKRKVEAIETIKKKLREHKEPRLAYRNVNKAL